MPVVASAAVLPPAAENVGVPVWVTSLTRMAVSDGTNWIRTDTGAVIA